MNSIDHLWVVICACFVFFMQAGFICYEVGFVRSKNVVSVAIENIIAFVVATLAYYMVGFAFMATTPLIIGSGPSKNTALTSW